MHELSKQIALVTGANKGIGFEVARQLGKAGLIVLLGARDAAAGEEAAATLRTEKLDVRFVHLDVTRPESIEAAAAGIEGQFQRLDVLVNNAGINDPADGPPSAADPAAVRRVMETNFLGTFLVTRAMLPLLRKAAAARIVNVSSGLGSPGVDIRDSQAARIFCLEGGAEHVDGASGLRITRNDDQSELRRSGLYRNRAEWSSRHANG